MTDRNDQLEALFDDLARALRNRISEPDCPRAVTSSAVKFLQNNEITAALTEDSALADLAMAIPQEYWTKQ